MNILLNAVTSLKKYSAFFWILSDFGLKFCVSDYLAQWILLLLLAVWGVNLFTAEISDKCCVPVYCTQELERLRSHWNILRKCHNFGADEVQAKKKKKK